MHSLLHDQLKLLSYDIYLHLHLRIEQGKQVLALFCQLMSFWKAILYRDAATLAVLERQLLRLRRSSALSAPMNECLLLEDLVQSCVRGKGGSEGHVLRDTTSRGLRGRV